MGTNSVGDNGKAQKPTVIKVNKKKVVIDNAKGGIKLTALQDEKFKTIFQALDGKLKDANGNDIGSVDNMLDSEEMQVIFGDLIQMSGRNKKLGRNEFKALIDKYGLQDVTVEDLEQFYNEVILQGQDIVNSEVTKNGEGERIVVTTDTQGNVETRNSDGSYSVKTGNTIDNFNSNNVPTSQSIDDGNGTITTVEYDLTSEEDRKPAKKIIAKGQTENTYEYQEDGKELLTRTVENKGIPAKEKTTTRQYDANQQLVGMNIQNANVETQYEYDENNEILIPKEEIINAGTENEIRTTFQVAGADLISETQTPNGPLRVLYSIETCNNREQIAELKKKSEILTTENGYTSLSYDNDGNIIKTCEKNGDEEHGQVIEENGDNKKYTKNANGYEQVTYKTDGTVVYQQEDNTGNSVVKKTNKDGTTTVQEKNKSKGTSVTQEYNSQGQLTFQSERDNKGNITQTTYGKDRITVKKWDSDQNFVEVVFNAHTKKQISQRQVPGPKLRAQMAQERERALAVSLGVNPNSMSKYNSSNNTIMVQLQDNGTKKKAVYRYTNTKTGKQESFTYTEYSNYVALPKYDYNTGKVTEMKYEMANTGSQGTWYYNDPDHRGRQKTFFYMNKAGHTAKPVFNARGEIIDVNYSPHFNTYKGRIIGDVAGTRSQVLVLCNGKYYYVDRNDGHVTTPKRVKGEVATNYAKQHGTQRTVNTVVADNYHRVEGTGNIEVTGIGSQGEQTLNSMGETVVVNGEKMDLLYDQYGNKYVVPTDGTFNGKDLALYNPKGIDRTKQLAIFADGDIGAEVFNRYLQAVTLANNNSLALNASENIIKNMIANIDMVLDSENPNDGFTSLKEYSKGDGASWDHRFVDWLAEHTPLGSKNEADTREFLENKKAELKELSKMNPNTPEFKNKFKQVFGVDFEAKNVALYFANPNSSTHTNAFGGFNAEEIASDYIESQYNASGNLKSGVTISFGIAGGILTSESGGWGAAGGAALASVLFDSSHLMTTGREINWDFFEKDESGKVKFDSNGLPTLGEAWRVPFDAAKEGAFFLVAGEGYKAIELSAQASKAFAKQAARFLEKNAPRVLEISKGLESKMTTYAAEAGYKNATEAAEKILAKQAAKTTLTEAEKNFTKCQAQKLAIELAEYEPAGALNALAENGLRQSIGQEFAQFTTQVLPKTVAFDVSLGMGTELVTTGEITPEGVATYATQSLLFQVGMRGAGSAYSRFKGRSKGEGPEITEEHELPPSNQSMSSTLADAVKPDPIPHERTGTLHQEPQYPMTQVEEQAFNDAFNSSMNNQRGFVRKGNQVDPLGRRAHDNCVKELEALCEKAKTPEQLKRLEDEVRKYRSTKDQDAFMEVINKRRAELEQEAGAANGLESKPADVQDPTRAPKKPQIDDSNPAQNGNGIVQMRDGSEFYYENNVMTAMKDQHGRYYRFQDGKPIEITEQRYNQIKNPTRQGSYTEHYVDDHSIELRPNGEGTPQPGRTITWDQANQLAAKGDASSTNGASKPGTRIDVANAGNTQSTPSSLNMDEIANLSVSGLEKQLTSEGIGLNQRSIIGGNGTIKYASQGTSVQIHYENGRVTAIKTKNALKIESYFKIEEGKPIEISKEEFNALKSSSDNAFDRALQKLDEKKPWYKRWFSRSSAKPADNSAVGVNGVKRGSGNDNGVGANGTRDVNTTDNGASVSKGSEGAAAPKVTNDGAPGNANQKLPEVGKTFKDGPSTYKVTSVEQNNGTIVIKSEAEPLSPRSKATLRTETIYPDGKREVVDIIGDTKITSLYKPGTDKPYNTITTRKPSANWMSESDALGEKTLKGLAEGKEVPIQSKDIISGEPNGNIEGMTARMNANGEMEITMNYEGQENTPFIAIAKPDGTVIQVRGSGKFTAKPGDTVRFYQNHGGSCAQIIKVPEGLKVNGGRGTNNVVNNPSNSANSNTSVSGTGGTPKTIGGDNAAPKITNGATGTVNKDLLKPGDTFPEDSYTCEVISVQKNETETILTYKMTLDPRASQRPTIIERTETIYNNGSRKFVDVIGDKTTTSLYKSGAKKPYYETSTWSSKTEGATDEMGLQTLDQMANGKEVTIQSKNPITGKPDGNIEGMTARINEHGEIEITMDYPGQDIGNTPYIAILKSDGTMTTIKGSGTYTVKPGETVLFYKNHGGNHAQTIKVPEGLKGNGAGANGTRGVSVTDNNAGGTNGANRGPGNNNGVSVDKGATDPKVTNNGTPKTTGGDNAAPKVTDRSGSANQTPNTQSLNADNMNNIANLSIEDLQARLRDAGIEPKKDYIVDGNGTMRYVDSNGADIQIHYENGKVTAIRVKNGNKAQFYKIQDGKPFEIPDKEFLKLKKSSNDARSKAIDKVNGKDNGDPKAGLNYSGNSAPVAETKRPSWFSRQYRRLFNKPETSVVDSKTGRQTDTYTRKGQVTKEVVTDTNHEGRLVSETEYNNGKPIKKTEYTYHMDGKPDKTIVTEYSNGKPHTQIEYTNGLETKVSTYRSNGELEQTTQNIYDTNNDLQARITSDYYKGEATTVKKESNFVEVNGKQKPTVERVYKRGKFYSKTEYEYSNEGKILKTVEETAPDAKGCARRTTTTSDATIKEDLLMFGDKQLVIAKTTENRVGTSVKSTETATYHRQDDGTLTSVEIIRYNERIVQTKFDPLERPLYEEVYNSDGIKTRSITYEYEGETRTEITTDLYNRVTTDVYKDSELISRKTVDNNTGVTTFEMFKQGNRTIEVQNIYDSQNIKIISEREVKVTDADGSTHTYKWEYDSNGQNPTPKIKYGRDYRQPRSSETVYDETGREYEVGTIISGGNESVVKYTIKENGKVIGTRTETTYENGTWKTEDVFDKPTNTTGNGASRANSRSVNNGTGDTGSGNAGKGRINEDGTFKPTYPQDEIGTKPEYYERMNEDELIAEYQRLEALKGKFIPPDVDPAHPEWCRVGHYENDTPEVSSRRDQIIEIFDKRGYTITQNGNNYAYAKKPLPQVPNIAGTQFEKGQSYRLNKAKDYPKLKLGNQCVIDLNEAGIKSQINALEPGQKLIIGRDGVKINDSYDLVSEKHIEIENVDGQIMIKDISRNGTRIAYANESYTKYPVDENHHILPECYPKMEPEELVAEYHALNDSEAYTEHHLDPFSGNYVSKYDYSDRKNLIIETLENKGVDPAIVTVNF